MRSELIQRLRLLQFGQAHRYASNRSIVDLCAEAQFERHETGHVLRHELYGRRGDAWPSE